MKAFHEWCMGRTKHRALELDNMDCRATLGSQTISFFTFKDSPAFEPFLDFIKSNYHRSLFLRFRYGTLPIGMNIVKWRNEEGMELTCPVCLHHQESEEHFLFFCPHYFRPRKKWTIPMCHLLSIQDRRVVLRLCKTSSLEPIVIAVSQFIGAAWRISS